MKSDPTDASAPFNLGNMLRASARTVEAEAALRAATRANPVFAEAWYNLADLLDDQGRSEAAVECLHKALVVAESTWISQNLSDRARVPPIPLACCPALRRIQTRRPDVLAWRRGY